jgi:hypothetical protein
MMKPADFGDRGDRAEPRGSIDRPSGASLSSGEVSSCAVIVVEVSDRDASQMPLAKDDDMIEALVPNRTDEPLREGVLPWALGRRQDFIDPHALHALPEGVTVDGVAIAEEIGRGGVVREGVHDLLGRPGGGGVLGHVEVEDASAIVGQYDEDEQNAQLYHRSMAAKVSVDSRAVGRAISLPVCALRTILPCERSCGEAGGSLGRHRAPRRFSG